MRIFTILILLLFAPWNNTYAELNKQWATYFGAGTRINDVLYDLDGYFYVAGYTTGTDINTSTPNAFKDYMIDEYDTLSNVHMSGFVAKFDSLGNIIWSTYVGNEGRSMETKIAFDLDYNIVVIGSTSGTQNLIGTPNAFSPNPPIVTWGTYYSYIIKFDKDGNRIWGSYFTDSNNPLEPILVRIKTVTVDKNGDILIAGAIDASAGFSFSSTGTFMPSWPYSDGPRTGFVIKMASDGSDIIWGTYLGGEKVDVINHVTTDSLDNVYLLGTTTSTTNIASTNAYSSSFFGGIYDTESFITKLDPNGAKLWGTYTNGIQAYGGMVINSEGDFYLAGLAIADLGVTTTDVHQEDYKGDTDFVLTKWNTNGEFIWGTYYGGESKERYYNLNFAIGTSGIGNNVVIRLDPMSVTYQSLALDEEENIILVGGTESESYIDKGCVYDIKNETAPYGFIAKFLPSGKLKWGSYLETPIHSIAYNPGEQEYYLVSSTNKENLATPTAYQLLNDYGLSGYIVKMEGDFICPDLAINITKQNDSLIITDDFEHYEWYRNDTLLDVNTAWIIPEHSGNYYAQLKDFCDCIHYSDTVWIAPVSSNDLEQTLSEVNIYPNPNNGVFYIQGSINDAALNKISIIINDIVGRTIFQDEILVEKNHFYHALDLTRLASGIYVITIMEGEKVHVLKWVKE